MVSHAAIAVLLICFLAPLVSQTNESEPPRASFPPRADESAPPAEDEAPREEEELLLPVGFGDIALGQSLERVQELLAESPFFFYRGKPDVSLRPFDGQPVIRVGESPFFASAQFQFSDEVLSIVTLTLDRTRVDYYSMFQLFTRKYGEAREVNPQFIVWENSEVVLRLEKPLTVKYIAREAFASSSTSDVDDPEREYFFEQF